MGKGQKPSWTLIFGIVIQLYFASALLTSEVAFRKDGLDPNYASLLKECKRIKLPNGTMIQTVPKLLQTPLVTACSTWKSKYGPPLTQAVCRFPDCLSNPCQNGLCEETLQGYQCLCFPGFRGKHCAERWNLPTDATTITPDSTMQETSPTSTSSPTTTAESSASTDATTVTSLDSTQPETSPTSTSGPPMTAMTTGSTTPTDAMTITPSDPTRPVTSPTSTSGPPSTTTSSARTDATTVTPSDSTLAVTSSKSTSRPPTATKSSAKFFVTDSISAIFVSEMKNELNFTSLPSTSGPLHIKYDPTEKQFYWSDWVDLCVYRANLDGTDQEQVRAARATSRDKITGIAIDDGFRILYMAYINAHKVTSMSIERGSPLPGTETDFVNHGIYEPRALIIDEEEGFLYISRRYGIVRALLIATNDIEEIYHNEDLTALTGLSIDLTRNPRRIFFSDWTKKRTFYKDVTTGANSDTSTAFELTAFLQDPYQESLIDVSFFRGILYWLKQYPNSIGIMTDYDQANRSYRVQEISQFERPLRMIITFIDP